MIKPITIQGDVLNRKLSFIVPIFGGISGTELDILTLIIQYSTNNSICITSDLSKQLQIASGVTRSAFSTSLHRLEKKGIFNRTGKTITLHPVFNNIEKAEKLLITFSAVPESNED